MKIQPKTKEEIDAMNLFQPGEYGFEVLEQAKLGDSLVLTEDTKSKIKEDGSGGNDMIVLVLNVFHPDGYSRVVIDYLLEAIPSKLWNACHACGLGDKYESGEITAKDFIGKQGNLRLNIQKGKLKNDGSGENYPDKNNVANYIVGKDRPVVTNETGRPPVSQANSFEDEIPF